MLFAIGIEEVGDVTGRNLAPPRQQRREHVALAQAIRPKRFRERLVGTGAGAGRYGAAQYARTAASRGLGELGEQPRFADAGLSAHDRRASLAARGFRKQRFEARALALAPRKAQRLHTTRLARGRTGLSRDREFRPQRLCLGHRLDAHLGMQCRGETAVDPKRSRAIAAFRAQLHEGSENVLAPRIDGGDARCQFERGIALTCRPRAAQ